MMLTLALDASTRCTGWSLFKNGEYVSSGIIDLNSDKDTEHRISEMTAKIVRLIKETNPNKIYLEDTMKMVNINAMKTLCWLAGGIRFWAYRKGYPIEMIMPAYWRSFVHIQEYKVTRKELKQRAIELCKKQFGIDAEEDRAEAIIMNYAMALRDNEL